MAKSMSTSSKGMIAVLFALMVSGCASLPQTPKELTRHSIEQATKFADQGDSERMQIIIDYAALLPEGAHQIAAFFQQRPDAADMYVNRSALHIDSMTYPANVAVKHETISVLRSAAALPAASLDAMQQHLAARAMQGNLDGTMRFELKDDPKGLGLMESPENSAIVLKNTIETAARIPKGSGRQIELLMAYATNAPASQKKNIEEALGSLYITQDEIPLVSPVFPEFAKSRALFLASGQDSLSTIKVGSTAWAGLSKGEQDAIAKNRRVSVLVGDSYGLIIDAQVVNRSTSGSTYGSAAGGAVGQAMYLNRAFDNNSYSMWSQIGAGLMGTIAGSAIDSAPTARYQHRYAVKLGSGDVKYVDQTSANEFRHAVGTCVDASSLDQLPQKLCEESAAAIKSRLLGKDA